MLCSHQLGMRKGVNTWNLMMNSLLMEFLEEIIDSFKEYCFMLIDYMKRLWKREEGEKG